MIKLALIGDASIPHYAVADRLWELLSVVTDTSFNYRIIPLQHSQDVLAFFESFRQDRSYVGFNIAIPWKDILLDQVDAIEPLVRTPLINTVYKTSEGQILGANTDPLAAQKAIEAQFNLYKCASVLIIGAGGSGLALAQHFTDNLSKKSYLYDSHDATKRNSGITHLSSLNDVLDQTYDLIINATPFGRFCAEHVDTFATPLDLDTLRKISHPGTIVQETNYLPHTTLLLQMAQHLGLPIVTGDLMLVYRAVESFHRYFNVSLGENVIKMLVGEIGVFIAERESIVFGNNRA